MNRDGKLAFRVSFIKNILSTFVSRCGELNISSVVTQQPKRGSFEYRQWPADACSQIFGPWAGPSRATINQRACCYHCSHTRVVANPAIISDVFIE